jgi:single-strand DNA-binding protein
MNNVALIGRLTRDPEVRMTTSNTAVGRYTLAVDRRFKKEGDQSADFIPCIAFGKSAEFAEKYLNKGMKIAVTGRIQTGSYTNREGQKVYTTDIVVETQEFVESKSTNDSSRQAKPQESPVSADTDGFLSVPDGIAEELPFV